MAGRWSEADLKNSQALRRKIRLKNLIDEGLQTRKLISQQSSERTLEIIRNINTASNVIIDEGQVGDRAEHTSEVVLDAEVQRMSHELLSKVLEQSSDFNERMYQNALTSIVFKNDHDSVNWLDITKVACEIARTARLKSTMLGAIDVQPKERIVKERQKRVKNTLADEKRPETVGRMKRADKGAQKVNMVHEQVLRLIRENDNEPLPYYKLIIDPDDFGNTVENAFQMSFLAVDNVIAIETGSDGYPYVRFTTKAEKTAEKEPSQSICTLNKKLFEDMKILYDIEKPMLNVKHIDAEDDDGDNEEYEDVTYID